MSPVMVSSVDSPSAMDDSKFMLRWLWLAVVVVVLDQATKLWADAGLTPYTPYNLFTGFNLTLSYNTGAAFSFLADAGGWQRWFFTVLAFVVSVMIIVWLRRLQRHEHSIAIALVLILGGAVGNVIDRIYLGHVVDFIDVYYLADSCLPFFGRLPAISGSSCHWPAFNIADSAIFIGAIMMVIDGLRGSKSKTSEE